jgi:tetratricopeptide (TPR) repeat protein
MHLTQARFIENLRDKRKLPNLFTRKEYGDSYLAHIPTNSHGQFSSYAMLGIQQAVPGYWGPIDQNLQMNYQKICQHALHFFNAYLKHDTRALENLKKLSSHSTRDSKTVRLEFKTGQVPPPAERELIDLIIKNSIDKVGSKIVAIKKNYQNSSPVSEGVLNWLGYHFLYWWGREKEAIEVFKLNTMLFPESGNAFDSLGEAYVVNGLNDLAISSYERSLKLNPENKNAASILEQLKKQR